MALSVTRATLREMIYEAADLQDSYAGTVPLDDHTNNLINIYQKRLYVLLADHNLYTPEYNLIIGTSSGAEQYALPTDLFRIKGIFDPDYNELQIHQAYTKTDPTNTGPAKTYRVYGPYNAQFIEFRPIPQEGNYYIRYIPQPFEFTSDSSATNYPQGWEYWIVLSVAIDLRTKNDLPTQNLFARLAYIEEQIEEEATKQRGLTINYVPKITPYFNRKKPYQWPYDK